MAVAVIPGPHDSSISDLQSGWQQLFAELQQRLTAAAAQADALWHELGSAVRSRIAPKVEVIAPGRLWELDFNRGVAIAMMLAMHLIHSWITVLSAALAGLAMALWTPVKGLLIAGLISIPMLGGAFLLSPTFGYAPPSGAGHPLAAALLPVAVCAAVVATGWWLATAGSGGSAFVFLMGVGMAVSHSRAQKKQTAKRSLFPKHLARGAQLLAAGIAITLLSYLLVPQAPIVFGILHLLGLATILAYPFLALPAWAGLAAGLPIIGLGDWLTNAHLTMNGAWGLPFGIRAAGLATLDYWPLLPWLGVVLLGIAVGKVLYPDGQRAFRLPDLSQTRVVRALSPLGRNSLQIYLFQEPLFLAGKALVLG
jgi:uncharacterized membrane protein